MSKLLRDCTPFIIVGVLWVSFISTGCSNGGEFSRNEKPTKDDKPEVVVVHTVPTATGTIPAPVIFELPVNHPAMGCSTCCYSIKDFQEALSECKDKRKKDHAICIYDHLFDNHDHEVDDEDS